MDSMTMRVGTEVDGTLAVVSPAEFTIDTTGASMLHIWLRRGKFRMPSASYYMVALIIMWLPLLLGAALTPTPLLLLSEAQPLRLQNDWNALFLFLLSFPCIFVFCANDQGALSVSLQTVQGDGTVTFTAVDAKALAILWEERFKWINIAGQVAGLIIGCAVAAINLHVYTAETVGYWIADHGRLLPIGVAFLFCIFFFYGLITLYVFRNIAVAVLFAGIVDRSTLRLLPMHPDKAGGLHPVGQLGLRNQYVLMLLGLNLVLLVTVTVVYLQPPRSLYQLIVTAVVFYFLLGPLVFVAPLLPFRRAMLRTKTELMCEVAKRVRVELHNIRIKIHSGQILKEDEELIDRLRKIAAVIDELPVWPFDAGTLKRFFASYAVPVLTTVGLPLAKSVYELVSAQLP